MPSLSCCCSGVNPGKCWTAFPSIIDDSLFICFLGFTLLIWLSLALQMFFPQLLIPSCRAVSVRLRSTMKLCCPAGTSLVWEQIAHLCLHQKLHHYSLPPKKCRCRVMSQGKRKKSPSLELNCSPCWEVPDALTERREYGERSLPTPRWGGMVGTVPSLFPLGISGCWYEI